MQPLECRYVSADNATHGAILPQQASNQPIDSTRQNRFGKFADG